MSKPLVKITKNSPLHLAVMQGDASAVKLLSTNDELLSSRNALGFTPLETALLLGKYELTQFLGFKESRKFKVQKKVKALF